jgi:hypothetical protein
MGTNYYVKTKACECCGHKEKDIHIGKSSMGWKFSFNIRFKTAREWFGFLADKVIHDEYGDTITLEELKDKVKKLQNGIWLYDPRYEESFRYKASDRLEFLDDEGHRFVNAEDFC